MCVQFAPQICDKDQQTNHPAIHPTDQPTKCLLICTFVHLSNFVCRCIIEIVTVIFSIQTNGHVLFKLPFFMSIYSSIHYKHTYAVKAVVFCFVCSEIRLQAFFSSVFALCQPMSFLIWLVDLHVLFWRNGCYLTM